MSVVATYYPIGENEDEYYVEIEQVLNDPEVAERVAENARKALVEWRRTYRIFELSPLTGRFPDIGRALKAAAKIRC